MNTYYPDNRNENHGKYTGYFMKDEHGKLIGFQADQLDLWFNLQQISILEPASPERYGKNRIIAYTRTEEERYQRYAWTYLDGEKYKILILGPIRSIRAWPEGYDFQANTSPESIDLERDGPDTFVEVTRQPDKVTIRTSGLTVTADQSGVAISVGKLTIHKTIFKADAESMKDTLLAIAERLTTYVKGFQSPPGTQGGPITNTSDLTVIQDIEDELKKVFE
ncbi:MAG: hypothetical protein HUU10_04535 [Bacteroidetes bacterium]|nr:hypothetical protein [Bacteroidota bacterium]